jgi:hypothetical protein
MIFAPAISFHARMQDTPCETVLILCVCVCVCVCVRVWTDQSISNELLTHPHHTQVSGGYTAATYMSQQHHSSMHMTKIP